MKDRTKSRIISAIVCVAALPMIGSPWLVGCRAQARAPVKVPVEIDCAHPNVTCPDLPRGADEGAEPVDFERVRYDDRG